MTDRDKHYTFQRKVKFRIEGNTRLRDRFFKCSEIFSRFFFSPSPPLAWLSSTRRSTHTSWRRSGFRPLAVLAIGKQFWPLTVLAVGKQFRLLALLAIGKQSQFNYIVFNHRHKRIDRLLIGGACLPALFWLSSYVARHHLAMTPQIDAKYQVYCTFYSWLAT